MLLTSVPLGSLSTKKAIVYWASASALYIPVSAAMLSCPPVAVCKLLTWTRTSPRDGAVSDRNGMQKLGISQKLIAFSTSSPLPQTARASIPYVLWCFFSEAGVTIHCVKSRWESNPISLVRARERFALTRHRVISYFFTAERRRLPFRRCCALNETPREKNRHLIVWVYWGLD